MGGLGDKKVKREIMLLYYNLKNKRKENIDRMHKIKDFTLKDCHNRKGNSMKEDINFSKTSVILAIEQKYKQGKLR